jgi:hypothetical protein
MKSCRWQADATRLPEKKNKTPAWEGGRYNC